MLFNFHAKTQRKTKRANEEAKEDCLIFFAYFPALRETIYKNLRIRLIMIVATILSKIIETIGK